MSWLRLDDGFASHPKIASLSDLEFRVWVRLLCYLARHRRPNFASTSLQEVPNLTMKQVRKYVQVRLLEKTEDGWEVHDWAKYQPKDSTGAERASRYRHGKKRDANRDGVTPRPVLPSLEGRKGTDVNPNPGSGGSASQPPSRALCPDCGISLPGPRKLAEHRYHQHDGPTPAHWIEAEAKADG